MLTVIPVKLDGCGADAFAEEPSCSRSVVRQGGSLLGQELFDGMFKLVQVLDAVFELGRKLDFGDFLAFGAGEAVLAELFIHNRAPPLCRVLVLDLEKFSPDGRRRTAKIFWGRTAAGARERRRGRETN